MMLTDAGEVSKEKRRDLKRSVFPLSRFLAAQSFSFSPRHR